MSSINEIPSNTVSSTSLSNLNASVIGGMRPPNNVTSEDYETILNVLDVIKSSVMVSTFRSFSLNFSKSREKQNKNLKKKSKPWFRTLQ